MFFNQRKNWNNSRSFHCYFGQVSENEINDYIKTGSPFDKAGSYGIQDPFGIRNIVSINGSYTNIIGLPVAQVLKKIKEIIIEN